MSEETTKDTESVVITVEELEKQGDIAADYIEELLDIADIDGDLEIEVRNDRPYVSVINEEGNSKQLRNLVGRNNQVLDAIQELTRLAVHAQTGEKTRLVLDIDGSRKKRIKVLEKIAHAAIEKVHGTAKNVHLEAMGSYERKLVHDIIAEADLVSESEGQGRNRHIVVKPKKTEIVNDKETVTTEDTDTKNVELEPQSSEYEVTADPAE
ncbi:MAG: R3H domain-containing nucleic acid-binding protein [Micrococcaceae bacterium]